MQLDFENLLKLPKAPSIKSPLGYPGGKRRLWKYLEPHLPDNLTHIVSPFMGGGSIELACTSKAIYVQGSDNFEPLMNFWEYFIRNSKDVIDIVYSIYPLSYKQRKFFSKTQLKKNSLNINNRPLSDLERAAIFLCINKQSFRGWTFAARVSRYEEIKPLAFFDKWRRWQNEYLEVLCSDYIPIIENADGRFLYLDPPYVEKEFYYGAYQEQLGFDHENLAWLLHKTKSKWIMSYGNHPLIRDLYKNYTILEPKMEISD